MTELHPLDSGFLELEDTDGRISLGIGGVAIMAGPAPTRAEFVAGLAERITRNQRLRQRVRRSFLGLTAPVWEDDPHFDLAHHVRWAALPELRDEQSLRELVAAELTERLDRDHPLWRCVVVEQLADGHWALMILAHHSMVDGTSGITLFEGLCDRPDSRAQRAEKGSVRRHEREGIGSVTGLMRAALGAPQLAASMLGGLIPVVYGAVAPVPSSSLNGTLGRQRRYGVARASLSEIREIGTAFGTTVNDVALAAVASSYRTVLHQRGEEPTAGKLRTLIPVSMRTPDFESVVDNRVSAMIASLPIESADAVERLRTVHDRVARHRRRGEADAEKSVLTMAEWLPYPAIAWFVRLLGRFPQHSVSALVTNVPGPSEQLSFLGSEVVEILPCIPIAMRLRSTIAILSYHDHVVFGITGDYDTTPDIDSIADGIEQGIGDLLTRARAVGAPP